MPKIAFLGFPASKVRLKVSQEDTTIEDTIDLTADAGALVPPTTDTETAPAPDPVTVPETEPAPQDTSLPAAPSGASVKLSSTRTTGTAPAGFFFSAVASGFGVEDHYFDVRYKWSFGDPGWYTRHDTDDLPWGKYYNVNGQATLVEDGSVPKGTGVRFLGNDKNVAFGPHVCHVFEKPGEYTVTCEVRKRGHAPLTRTMKVTVKDPAVEFPGTDTICWSPSGNFSGAPTGSTQVTTWDQVRMAAQSGPTKRVLLHRGESGYARSSAGDIFRSEGHTALHLGAYGTGADPVWTSGRLHLISSDASADQAIWGINFQGHYDPTDPWNTSRDIDLVELRDANRQMLTVWDCRFDGWDKAITTSSNDFGKNVIVGNTSISNWGSYGIFFHENAGWMGMCGAWIKMGVDAVRGPNEHETVPPICPDNSSFRSSALGGPVAFNLCDFRMMHSWAPANTFDVVDYQSGLRIGRRNGAMPVEEAVVERCRCENGPFLGTGNSGQSARPRKYLWDKCYSLRANGGPPIATPNVSGQVIRNCIIVIPNAQWTGCGRLKQIVDRSQRNATDYAIMSDYGLDFHNNTIADLRSGQGDMSWGPISNFSIDDGTRKPYGWVKIGNNIVYVPNKTISADTNDEPLDLTVLWTSEIRGQYYLDSKRVVQFNPNWKPGSRDAAVYGPAAGSSAIGAASVSHSNVGNGQGSKISIDDFFGRVRGADASRGAIEVNF